MSIQGISAISIQFCSCSCQDQEAQEIARRLREYGVIPTGDKSADRAKLHEIELKKAELENCVTNKFLTVSKSEQEKIQKKKKEKRRENNPELKPEEFKGSKAFGQQVMLAIEMKKKKNTSIQNAKHSTCQDQ